MSQKHHPLLLLTEKELDLLEGMQRTAQKESAGRAFSYRHKTHGLQETVDTVKTF